MNTCSTNMSQPAVSPNTSMEEHLKQQALIEDQIDYQFIQRIIQELTQSCALNVPIPASAIPNLILQAAQFFWENDDQSIEERYYCIPYNEIMKCGPNKTIKLPPQIISVFGVYKLNNTFNYGVLGDFSLERMILNNSALAAGAGGSLSDVFGTGTGYNLIDVMGALNEVQTYKYMFDYPITFNFTACNKKNKQKYHRGEELCFFVCFIFQKNHDNLFTSFPVSFLQYLQRIYLNKSDLFLNLQM